MILYIVTFVIGLALGRFHELRRFVTWASKRYGHALLFFIIGVSAGAIGYYELTLPPKSETERDWQDTFNKEEKTHKLMVQFQTRLDALKTDGTADSLSKQIETQGEIEDLIVKFREAQHAKYAWLVDALAGLVGAVLGAGATLLVSKGGASRGPE